MPAQDGPTLISFRPRNSLLRYLFVASIVLVGCVPDMATDEQIAARLDTSEVDASIDDAGDTGAASDANADATPTRRRRCRPTSTAQIFKDNLRAVTISVRRGLRADPRRQRPARCRSPRELRIAAIDGLGSCSLVPKAEGRCAASVSAATSAATANACQRRPLAMTTETPHKGLLRPRRGDRPQTHHRPIARLR